MTLVWRHLPLVLCSVLLNNAHTPNLRRSAVWTLSQAPLSEFVIVLVMKHTVFTGVIARTFLYSRSAHLKDLFILTLFKSYKRRCVSCACSECGEAVRIQTWKFVFIHSLSLNHYLNLFHREHSCMFGPEEESKDEQTARRNEENKPRLIQVSTSTWMNAGAGINQRFTNTQHWTVFS